MSRLYVGLDTDFILSVAQGVETHLGCIDAIAKMRAQAIVCPSVLQELEDIAEKNSVRSDRDHAARAVQQLNEWGILAPPLEAVDHGIAELFARRLVDGEGTCFQSVCVLGESAMLGCRLLLTDRQELLGIDPQRLKLALIERDLTDCMSVPPDIFLEFFSPAALAVVAVAGAPS